MTLQSTYEGVAASDRAEAVTTAAKEATLTEAERSDSTSARSALQMADVHEAYAKDLRIVGWSVIGGAVVLIGAAVLAVVAHRRRASRLTGAAAQTSMKVTKQVVSAIALMVLGLTAGGFGVAAFTSAAHTEVLAELQLITSTEYLNEGQFEAANRNAKFAAETTSRADQWAFEAWLLTAGAVVLIGSGVLVLRAHHRRAPGATADATATQVIQRS